MADTRIIANQLAPVAPPGAPARTEAIIAAQAAFFQAALAGREVTAAAPPARTEAKAAAAPRRLGETASDVPSDRVLRPGSLLDIKV